MNSHLDKYKSCTQDIAPHSQDGEVISTSPKILIDLFRIAIKAEEFEFLVGLH